VQSRWRNRTAEVLKCKCSSPRRIRDQSTRLVSFARHEGMKEGKNHEQSRLVAEFFRRFAAGTRSLPIQTATNEPCWGSKVSSKVTWQVYLELPVETRTETCAGRPSSIINHDRISDLRSRRLGFQQYLRYNPAVRSPR